MARIRVLRRCIVIKSDCCFYGYWDLSLFGRDDNCFLYPNQHAQLQRLEQYSPKSYYNKQFLIYKLVPTSVLRPRWYIHNLAEVHLSIWSSVFLTNCNAVGRNGANRNSQEKRGITKECKGEIYIKQQQLNPTACLHYVVSLQFPSSISSQQKSKLQGNSKSGRFN